jgi:hypothetical protein
MADNIPNNSTNHKFRSQLEAEQQAGRAAIARYHQPQHAPVAPASPTSGATNGGTLPSPSLSKDEWTPAQASAEFGRWHQHERFQPAMLGTNGKVPSDFDETGQPCGLRKWNRAHGLTYLKRAANAGANLGIRTSDFPVTDIDCPNRRVADAVEATIAAELGVSVSDLSVRWRGDSSKRAVMFALKPGAEKFRKMSVVAVDASSDKQRLEILADGQQSVWAGVHPDTGAKLQIRGPHPADVGPEKMVEIDAEIAQRLLKAAADAMVHEGCKLGSVKTASAAPSKEPPKRLPRELLSRWQWLNQLALDHIMKWAPKAFPHGRPDGHPESPGCGWRVNAEALGRTCQEDLAVHVRGIQDWGQDWGDRAPYTPLGLLQAFLDMDQNGEVWLAANWDGDRPLGTVTLEQAAAWLCAQLGVDWEAEIAKDKAISRQQVEEDFDDESLTPHEAERGQGADGPGTAKRITATPFVLRDPKSIEPRRWLYGWHYIWRYLSATVAPGGLGKSSLALVEAIAMAARTALLGVLPAEQLRVWYWNGEEPFDENDRRATAICLHYGIKREDIDGYLFIDSGRDTEIVIARAERHGVKVAEPVVAALRRTIQANKIDVVIIDPFVSSHGVPESDNGAINAVCRQWAMLAEETGCAIELVHHVRKGAAGQIVEHVVDDARGASALVNAARSVRVLNRMTEKEAGEVGVAKPRSFFRSDNGKANHAPPAENSTWHQIVGVPLGNDRGPVKGDNVGVVVKWTWPDRAAGLAPDDVRAIQGVVLGGEWRADPRAKKNWAGHAVADALELDLSKPGDRARAKAILNSLVEDGSLKVVHRRNKDRKRRSLVVVGERMAGVRKTQFDDENDDENEENSTIEW